MIEKETDDVDADVIVVGGGVAGALCACQIARSGRQVILIERGGQPGSKNLSGGVFYCRVMERIFPDFLEAAPIERHITRNVLCFLNPSSHFCIDSWDRRLADPVNAVTVLRARLDAWLLEKCEEAGVMVMPGVRVDALLTAGDRVTGVRAGTDELRARMVVAADGVNSFIARSAGIRAREPAKNLAVGVKSVIGLPAAVIEDRFRVSGNEGVAYAMVGDCTQGVAGGGFLYTNRESISVGVVMRLDDLDAKGVSSSRIHDHFLAHPAVAPLIKGGELREYGAHLTIENGPAMASHDIARPGLLIVGDAAGFTLNTGLAVRGMDLAAGSALAAARAIDRAFERTDFGQRMADDYRAELDASFVGADMKTYARAPEFLENPRMYEDYGPLLADIFLDILRLDTTPKSRAAAIAAAAFRRSPVTLFQAATDMLKGGRAL
ncbi:MAG: FAD-dependent oxidoreductase [Telmatospirillum sp.]|nr:FAD-dependent oxidoreductase [Telmatospirillum sp.]